MKESGNTDGNEEERSKEKEERRETKRGDNCTFMTVSAIQGTIPAYALSD